MPSVERSLTIDVPPATVYEAFVDLSRWLEWNPQLREVTPLSEGPLAVGSKTRIAGQMMIGARVWEVTELNPGRSFAWKSSFPGLRLVFDHIAEGADGGTRATIRIDIEGPLAFLTGLAGTVYGRNFLDRSLGALKAMLDGEATPAPAPEQPPAAQPEPEPEPEPVAEAAAEAEPEPEAGTEAEAETETEAKNE